MTVSVVQQTCLLNVEDISKQGVPPLMTQRKLFPHLFCLVYLYAAQFSALVTLIIIYYCVTMIGLFTKTTLTLQYRCPWYPG